MIRRVNSLFCLLLLGTGLYAQNVSDRLSQAVSRMLEDPQMRYATLALEVVNSQTGAVVFAHQPNTGVAPASCQKVITSATVLELLGPQYRYQTRLAYDGQIQQGRLNGDLHILGSGDPSLGSWRYDSSGEDNLLRGWLNILKQQGIKTIHGSIQAHPGLWESASVPGGWIWDDIGNYYGAGAHALNWRENQYDMLLQSGPNPGDKVNIVKTIPALFQVQFTNELKAGKKGSGDNAYIYLAPESSRGVVRGTIPPGEKRFVISGSLPDPATQLLSTLARLHDSAAKTHTAFRVTPNPVKPLTTLYTQYSPPLDSLVYWFMKKSINLYGEAFVKTIGAEKGAEGSSDKGLELLKKFWKEQGIDENALRMIDGSGLSPQNRVTAHALVQVLQYARKRPWFDAYYNAFPDYNQMKLKSGTIGGSKGFAGYHTARDGTTYTVAIVVNNYNGSASEIVKKMYGVLNELK
ncbi:MAG: D-alanyl-D-alanine carboxypeptidase/D-alanyl-D-alanine-endopeptidase [Chitinophagaceae bacterium]|nr:D-alanyl-D-alanine carboxypeptidase/D-alanyl-D-alanine-endopeptidase [Chitinophagaceae bacterium]